mmetsp:Transcript_13990/g.16921  ORF Transcript_13990/g.16921 Transcript_13990/m.16921 type:complete len:139 (-) Transcript_13990:1969-2385(-)
MLLCVLCVTTLHCQLVIYPGINSALISHKASIIGIPKWRTNADMPPQHTVSNVVSIHLKAFGHNVQRQPHVRSTPSGSYALHELAPLSASFGCLEHSLRCLFCILNLNSGHVWDLTVVRQTMLVFFFVVQVEDIMLLC